MAALNPAPEPLPPGKPIVDGRTGEIIWEFPSEFQQALYELMKNRRRARTCRQCGRYFIADKTAQAFCSTGCAGDAKRATALIISIAKDAQKECQRMKKGERNDLQARKSVLVQVHVERESDPRIHKTGER